MQQIIFIILFLIEKSDDFIDDFRPQYKEKKTVHAQLLRNTQNN